MALANDIIMNGFVATYLASPQGKEMVARYLSSAEGQGSVREYLATTEGKRTAKAILPLLLEGIDLPDNIRISVYDAINRKSRTERNTHQFPESGFLCHRHSCEDRI